jgi:acetyltransferase-like isoleucine patch superfamily enzyme
VLGAARRKLERDGGLSRSTVRKGRNYLFGIVKARLRLVNTVGRGRGVRVNGGLKLSNDGVLTIGAGTVLRGVPTAVELATGTRGDLAIGKDVLVNSGTSISAHGTMRIGDRTLIGPYVMIIDSAFHELHDRSSVPAPRHIEIGNDVWIGAKASILPGVRIGDGAVIGAHALVNKDVEPFTVVAGIPARVVSKIDPATFVRKAAQ